MDPNFNRLSTVHDALSDASQERIVRDGSVQMAVGSFKCEERTQANAMDICAMNGTSLSAFLRNCCRRLVADYQPRIPTGAAPIGVPEGVKEKKG